MTDTAGWQPDRRFIGHPNSIALVVDEADNLYLLGLHTVPKSMRVSRLVDRFLGADHITGLGLGKDRVELFRVLLDASPTEPKARLEKLALKKFKCHKSAFRFGASARVTSADAMEFIACQAELLKKHPRKVQIEYSVEQAVRSIISRSATRFPLTMAAL